MIEAYFVRLLSCEALHLKQMVASTTWKQYWKVCYETDSSEKVDCFMMNNLNKTSADIDINYQSFRRGRRLVDFGRNQTTNEGELVVDKTKNVDYIVLRRCGCLMSQIGRDVVPGSAPERQVFQSVLDELQVVDNRVTYFLKTITDGTLRNRFVAFSKEQKVNSGNVTASGATISVKDVNNTILLAIYQLAPAGSTTKHYFWAAVKAPTRGSITEYTPQTMVDPRTGKSYPLFEIGYDTFRNRFKSKRPKNKTGHRTGEYPPEGLKYSSKVGGPNGMQFTHNGYMLLNIYYCVSSL
jgi:hypothetical protein